MQCSWPHLARLALQRLACLRVQPTCYTASIPTSSSPATVWCAKLHTAAEAQIRPSPTQSTTRLPHEPRWQLCRTINLLLQKNEVHHALHYVEKLPLSLISSRRYSHVLLHGLIRNGSTAEASFYAQHCLNRGIKLHLHSLDAVISNMIQDVRDQPLPGPLKPITPFDAPTILKIAPATNQNPELVQSALALYEAERASGKRPADRLFRYLITLCIINGEIILASLLFGTIMREWQARDMTDRALGNPPSSQFAGMPEEAIRRLRRICIELNKWLVVEATDSTSQNLHSASLQALAQLVYALDHGQLPYGLLNLLIKTMLLCPRGPTMVWIPGDSPDDPPQHVNAYAYIHDVLHRLMNSLCMRRRHVEEHRYSNFTWLQNRDYFKLLEYALKHRRSLDATRDLMQHIVKENPDALQAPEVRNVFLHAVAAFPEGVIGDFMKEFNLKIPELKWDPNTTDYTYSTVINAMTRAGQSRAVLDAIPDLLPGLLLPKHDDTISPAENMILRRDLTEEGLRRGAQLGPVVFVCLMNAARSVANVKFCERIFQFALAAQQWSWTHPDVVPWCLPTHAYTLMLRAYAYEMRFGMEPVAVKWGEWKAGELVPRPVMARRMILVTIRLMIREARRLEHLVSRMRPHQRHLRQAWRNIPYPDGFFFNALISIFKRTPDDPIYAALKLEMEDAGFRPPPRYLDALKRRNTDIHPDLKEQCWRDPKDIRPYALPAEDIRGKTHAPALYTKMVPKKLRVIVDDQ